MTNTNIIQIEPVNVQPITRPAAAAGAVVLTDIDRDLVRQFIDYLDVSDASQRTYINAMRQFKHWFDRDGGIFTRETIKRYKDWLVENEYKPTTIQTYLAALRLFGNYLVDEHGFSTNIAQHIKTPKLSRAHKKDALTADQLRELLGSVDRSNENGRRDYAMLLLMSVCGLRTIEISRANVGDMRTAGGRPVLYVQGKGRTEREDIVRLPAPVEAAIRQTLLDREQRSNDDPLFVSYSNNNHGGRLTTRRISAVAKAAFKSIGIDSSRFTAHSLRHTAVTLALVNGVDLQVVQQFARHVNITTTQIYAHNLNRLENESENAICSAIF